MGSICEILIVTQCKNDSVMPGIVLGVHIMQIFNTLVVFQAIVTIIYLSLRG